ncbi:hypothetical protein BWQ96_04002 [Gracilariopsis chorda]|uniref:Uncharacterized protein n=1 Tax=Gracilariopsis chorda TaxID=448386 RepID=A0A2V3IX00_9FLOR|nr:hypothetical protein BWQ96_04002 [Gracilariopsis chorda]|eukprot:PXF46217.1 hypothetical protein BWQ96_04002 [Gracilariopsis chorda]
MLKWDMEGVSGKSCARSQDVFLILELPNMRKLVLLYPKIGGSTHYIRLTTTKRCIKTFMRHIPISVA